MRLFGSSKKVNYSKKFQSQNAQDKAAKVAKDDRKKGQEAKANRTETGRTTEQEGLAITSQLLDRVELELPFRSSQ